MKPIEQCYWVVPGKLLAGEYPRNKDEVSTRGKIGALVDAGVKVFVDLTEEDEGLLPYAEMLDGVRHLRFPIRDVSVPASPEVTVAILDTIDAHLHRGEMVYVHCWGGVGRTGVIIGCWLARHGQGGESALGRLRELWQHCPKSSWRKSPETLEQERYITAWMETARITTHHRYTGCLIGLAVGDALGTTVEFRAPGTFIPVTTIVGGGPFRLKAGEWTDDTSMALCLAESLISCKDFDARDQMERYLRWYREGHLSSNGRCFDIGNTVRAALDRFARDNNPFAGSNAPRSAGNGSLMRLGPVPMFYGADLQQAIAMSRESSRTTHGAEACLDACRYFGGMLAGALRGVAKEDLLSPRYSPIAGGWKEEPLCDEIVGIADGSFKRKNPSEIVGSGYVVQSLEAALWAFYNSSSFAEGCLLAVNLGNDADTTGAIYGQLAGAYYGLNCIPGEWRECLAHRQLIEVMAVSLMQQSDFGDSGSI
jgi:ADP-ribosyl-[dinitrogen reductase] hydrolase